MEIITKLVDMKLLDIIFTNDGKEYVTPKQLLTEMKDELIVNGGKVLQPFNQNLYEYCQHMLYPSHVTPYFSSLNLGRINLVELAKVLNVDLSHITQRAAELQKQDPSVSLVLGQLVDKTYTTRLAEEINEKLIQQGQVSISDLTRQYDLPSEFLQQVCFVIISALQ